MTNYPLPGQPVPYELFRVADGGFRAVAPVALGDLSLDCWQHSLVTGEARFCILSVAFRELWEWWRERDALGGVPIGAAEELDQTLLQLLPEILEKPPPDAAARASVLRDVIRNVIARVEAA